MSPTATTTCPRAEGEGDNEGERRGEGEAVTVVDEGAAAGSRAVSQFTSRTSAPAIAIAGPRATLIRPRYRAD